MFQKTRCSYLFIIIFAYAVFCSFPARGEKQNLTLQAASEFDYPPLALVHEDGRADGFSVELLKAVVQAVGLEVDIRVGPWHEIKQELIDGRLDVLPLVSYSVERDQKLDFTVPYLRMRGSVFVRKGEKRIRTESDLKNKEILVMRGDSAHEYAVHNRLSDHLVLTDSFEEALTMLSEGKHDAVLVHQLVGLQLIKKLGIANVIDIHHFQQNSLKPVTKPITGFEQKFCMAVIEGDKKLLGLLNEGLSIVITDGRYDALYQKWFSPLLPKTLPSLTHTLKYFLLYIVVPALFLMAVGAIWLFKKEVARKTRHLRREIAERKRIENDLLLQKNIESELAELSSFLLTTSDFDDISYRVLETAKKLTKSRYGYVGFVDEKTGCLTCPTMTRDIWTECNVPDKSITFESHLGLWGWVLDHKQKVLLNELENDPRSNGVPEGHIPIQAFLSVPAVIGEQLVGQIALANPENLYMDIDLQIAERLAALYALSIQHQKYENALVESESRKAEELENQVKARTAELTAINRQMVMEIKQRKAIESELLKEKETARLFLGTLHNSPLALVFFVSNREQVQMLDWNKASEKLFGWTKEEVLGRNFFDFLPASDDIPQVSDIFQTLIEHPGSHNQVNWCNTQSGRPLLISWFNSSIYDPESEAVYVVSLGQDITLQNKYEKKLQENKGMLQAVFDGINEPLLLMQQDAGIMMMNKAAREYYQTSIDQNECGRPCFSVFHNAAVPCENCPVPSAVSGREFISYERKGFRNQDHIEHITVYPLNDKGNTDIAAIMRINDVTAEKQMEQELMQADKMISLGVLVSGIAHEINNPNNFIMLNAPLLKDAWESIIPILDRYYEENGDFMTAGLPYSEMKEEVPALFNSISEGGKRIQRIVQGLKDYSRKDDGLKNENIRLCEVIRHAISLIKSQIKKSTHHFYVSCDEAMPIIQGSSQKLEQVFINLIQNACQALPDMDKSIQVTADFDPNANAISVSVQDQGVGIPEKELSHILDPFFTTKRSSGGTGLGLSVSSNIIKEHGGRLEVKSQDGRGSVFTVHLPLSPQNALKKILVVDDDAVARKMILSALSDNPSYALLEAANGTEASVKLGVERPDLVFLDIEMPDIDGVEICRIIKSMPALSAIEVIIITAYSESPKLKEAAALGFKEIMFKPIDLKALRQNVHLLLNRHKVNAVT